MFFNLSMVSFFNGINHFRFARVIASPMKDNPPLVIYPETVWLILFTCNQQLLPIYMISRMVKG
jgi:hypothetical protein